MLTIFHKRPLDEPSWLAFAYVVGYDGEGDGDGDAGEGGDGDGDGDGDGEEDDESQLPENIKAILKKERDARAAAEKKAKLLERNAKAANAKGTSKAKAGEGAKTGSQGTQDDDEEGSAGGEDPRYAKMVEKFRTNSLRDTVSKLAQNFADPADVYRFLDTDLFDYTQDDDDPSEVVWDESEIKAAIKALGKEKPYLLKAVGDGQGTGSRKAGPKFAGKGSGRQTSGLDAQDIARRFPAMRHATRAGNKSE